MAEKKTVKKTTAKNKKPAAVKTVSAKTPVKKTPAKKSPTKTAALKSTAVVATSKEIKETPEKSPKESSQQQMKLRKPYLILIIVIIVLGALFYYCRGLLVAAVVNGQPISRLAVVQQAEKQSGKQTLDTLVRDALIEQEAKKENVSVSDQDVNTQIATLQSNLQKQGQNINGVLASQGMTMDDLRNLIRLDQLVQKMVGKNIKVSNQEVTDYLNQNKASLPNESQAQLEKDAKTQLLQQKTNAAVQTWLTNLQNKANIVYFVQY